MRLLCRGRPRDRRRPRRRSRWRRPHAPDAGAEAQRHRRRVPGWTSDGRKVILGARQRAVDLRPGPREGRRGFAQGRREGQGTGAPRQPRARRRRRRPRPHLRLRPRPTTSKRRRRDTQPVEVRVVVPAARDEPRGTLLLRGGRALTMKGHEIIENADVVMRDNRIAARRRARAASRCRRVRRSSTSPARRSCRASWTRTITRSGCFRKSTPPRPGSTWRTSPTG